MEEILIISNYYPPEKGAAANRIEQLALKLQQKHYAVKVLCPLGNYPKGQLFDEYKGKFYARELRQGIAVRRLWIYPSVSRNPLVRMVSVLSFTTVLFFYLLLKKTPQKVVVQSPPLLLSFVALLVLSFKRKKIILNVSDLWPLAAIELGALKKDSLSHRVLLRLEKSIYKKASVVLGQSNEILAHVKKMVAGKACHLYRNFPDQPPQETVWNVEKQGPIRLFYAGLLGVAQGVHELCERIDLSPADLELHLFGDGAEKAQIEALIASGKIPRLFYHGMLERHELHQKIRDCDIAVVPLKTRIYGSVPSKIFEYGALGFPVLYFGGGEGEEVVAENELGWVVPVGDYGAFNQTLAQIATIDSQRLQQMKKKVFHQAQKAFDLEAQIDQLIEMGAF